MQTRLWLASAATVALVTSYVFVASPSLHGQAPSVPGSDTTPDAATLDVIKSLDVKAIVDEAMQDMPCVAALGSRPRIGVSTRDVSDDEARAAGLSGITGAYVSDVPADSVAGRVPRE